MHRSIQEILFNFAPARWAVAALFLVRGYWSLSRSRLYEGLLDLCWVARLSGARLLANRAHPGIFGAIATMRRSAPNPLIGSYLAHPAADACARVYSLAGGTHDLFRDLIVLKAARPDEHGVILLKYARTFDGVVALCDLPRLMARYTFVLEPCWAGYCHPSTLMYIAPDHPVFIQCFTDEDHQFVAAAGSPLVPLRLGPADWVDADLFAPRTAGEKSYDLVMVANWSPQKRHALLFSALERIQSRQLRVLLVGFPWANRTADDVRREARGIRNPRVSVDVIEQVPQVELAAHVSRCKAFVFLNRKEGDNKALVEAMFADVPAIVYDRTIGGARSRINRATGILTSEAALAQNIEYMLDHHREFTPRAWSLEHTGSANATRGLNEALRQSAAAQGRPYTEGIVEKVNSPNLAYKDPADRLRFQADYDFALACLRDRVRPGREAVVA